MDNISIIAEHDTYLVAAIANASTRRRDLAYLTPDPTHPNWHSVQWIERIDGQCTPYNPAERDCWAWVEAGVLYLPSDGQTDRDQRGDDDTPDPEAGWYDPQSGIPAISGIPGTTLVRFI